MSPFRFQRAALLGLLITAATGIPTKAGLYKGAGANAETNNAVSAEADFSVSGSTFKIVLTNTTGSTTATPGTTIRGDILTGIVFNINGASPVLTLSSVSLTDSSDKRFTSKTASDTTNPLVSNFSTTLGTTPLASYGASVIGFNGAFQNPSGGAGGKNGIVADGTFPAPSGVGTSNSFNTAFPLHENSLTLTFAIAGASFTTDALKDVRFLFGTNGAGLIAGTAVNPPPGIQGGLSAVPEPATLASAGVALICGVLGAVRRRSKA